MEANLPANLEEPPQLAKVTLHTASPILDLCTSIHNSPSNAYLDYLLDIRKRYFRFFLGPKSVREKESSISLEELLEGDPRRFPLAKRVLVATILASSLLQLQRTQWMKDGWSKRDVFFRTRDGVVIFEQMYFSTEFASCHGLGDGTLGFKAENSEQQSTYSVEADMTASFTSTVAGKNLTIETSTMTDSFSSVQPFHLKTSLECLGIVLIELCFCEPIERGEDKVKVRPHGPNNDKPNHDFCLAIANAWTWEEISASEPSFSDPVEMCLRFPNLGRAKQGRYDEIVQDMYSAIVKPLQDEMNRRWQPGLDQTICV